VEPFSARTTEGTSAKDRPGPRRCSYLEPTIRGHRRGRGYTTLSNRFGDIFSVLGQLPDGFEDQWIDAVLRDRQAVKNFSQRVEKARPPMELRYMRDVADDRGLDWEYTERVLSSRDLDEWMRQGW
jgi:hypothetical protein